MDSVQLRLELIKLAFKPHEKPENAIKTAEALEAYVLRDQGSKTPAPVVPKEQNSHGHQGNKNKNR